ncbi:MAG: hypothetical protein H0W61_10020 [Bacteroidetes bacterium]|nr:hypothetical protein [Bacteroidota bacterium]
MKKIAIVAFMTIFLTSCEKFDIKHPFKKEAKEKPCAIVTRESLNADVLAAFKVKYPTTTDETWYNKDNNGFAATFTLNGKKTLALFNNDGSFANEQEGDNQEGDHQDSNNDDKGCSCELEGED